MLNKHVLRTFSVVPLKKIILTDVSLLNSTKDIATNIFNFHRIIANHSPNYIELGKLDKISLNNISFYDYTKSYLNQRGITSELIVNRPTHMDTCSHISFMTSISPDYQEKTENLSIKETQVILERMKKNEKNIRKKLYITCINECPITGAIDIDFALHQIKNYHQNYNFDELSLCDTCGTLDYKTFKYIIGYLNFVGIPSSKIGFQLRINENIDDNIRYGLKNGFIRWDVIADDLMFLRGPLTYKVLQKWI
jgi:hypothetical protein